MEKSLRINLLGKRFDLPLDLVADAPHTLLGNSSLLNQFFRPTSNDYYLQRNPLLFPYIFTYYTLEKKIFCPHHIPLKLLKIECEFFQLTNAQFYHERKKTETFQYFTVEKKTHWIDRLSFCLALLFMLILSLQTSNNSNQSCSFVYVIELVSTLLLTSSILYRVISIKTNDDQSIFRQRSFLFDFFSSVMSLILLASETFFITKNSRGITIFIFLCKTSRLTMIIGHLRILRFILMTFVDRFQIISILVLINILLTGSLAEIAFAFERRQQDELHVALEQSTMKTHLDAFWWATSLSFTIGFGYTDPHSTLTTVGRFCSYLLTFFGLLFNGLILQELIKGFLKISRENQLD